jgi:TRAP-type C4-dicarboxylate transport system substrate-binding protein
VGGAPATLRLAVVGADTSVPPDIGDFVVRVDALSEGRVHVVVKTGWASFAPDAEAQIVRAVAAGDVDLGVVGTRVFDTLGLPGFAVLSAPMLIDSNEAVRAVLDSPVPSRLLPELDRLGVRGLAMGSNGIRLPVAVKRPLRSPPDWRGISFGTFRSAVQERAINALGATPREVIGLFRVHGVQTGELAGYEFDPWLYTSQGSATFAPYMTANLALWPLTEMMIGNPAKLAALTATQRGWVRQAATATAAASVDLTKPTPDALRASCQLGAHFVQASEADITAMREAFEPVYQYLESDPATRDLLAEITRIKSAVRSGALFEVPSNCAR